MSKKTEAGFLINICSRHFGCFLGCDIVADSNWCLEIGVKGDVRSNLE